MGVLIKNADITIYHHYYDENKLDAYKRINIDGVNLNSKRNVTVSDKGVNIYYTTMIVADNGDYEIDTEDLIVKGNITLDITKATDLKGYTVLKVVGLQENSLLETINIECK